MKQVSQILGPKMALLAAGPEHAPFLLDLRQQERKAKLLSGTAPNLQTQLDWMAAREQLANDAYFVVVERLHPQRPLGSVRLHDVRPNEHSICVGSWVMIDGVGPRKTIEALSLAIQYVVQQGYPNCHFSTHQNQKNGLAFYKKLGAKEVGQSGYEVLLQCPPTLFLQRLEEIYRIPAQSIEAIVP